MLHPPLAAFGNRLGNNPKIGSFRNFVLALNFLYAIGAIDYERGFLSRI